MKNQIKRLIRPGRNSLEEDLVPSIIILFRGLKVQFWDGQEYRGMGKNEVEKNKRMIYIVAKNLILFLNP